MAWHDTKLLMTMMIDCVDDHDCTDGDPDHAGFADADGYDGGFGGDGGGSSVGLKTRMPTLSDCASAQTRSIQV